MYRECVLQDARRSASATFPAPLENTGTDQPVVPGLEALTDPELRVLARGDEEHAPRLRTVDDREADMADFHVREEVGDRRPAGGDVETAHGCVCVSEAVEW